MGILELLSVIFIVLKLINVITWSWILVLSPLIIGITIDIIVWIVAWLAVSK